jgi:hypothetical protein
MTTKVGDILITPGSWKDVWVGHVLIVTNNNPEVWERGPATIPNGNEIIHATSDRDVHSVGLEVGDGASVYRSQTLQTSRAKIKKINQVVKILEATKPKWKFLRAAVHGFRCAEITDDTNERLIKYHENIEKKSHKIMGEIYCSELAVISVQLGLLLDDKDPAWIPLDGKHTRPSVLRDWFDANPTDWQRVGRMDGGVVRP